MKICAVACPGIHVFSTPTNPTGGKLFRNSQGDEITITPKIGFPLNRLILSTRCIHNDVKFDKKFFKREFHCD